MGQIVTHTWATWASLAPRATVKFEGFEQFSGMSYILLCAIYQYTPTAREILDARYNNFAPCRCLPNDISFISSHVVLSACAGGHQVRREGGGGRYRLGNGAERALQGETNSRLAPLFQLWRAGGMVEAAAMAGG